MCCRGEGKEKRVKETFRRGKKATVVEMRPIAIGTWRRREKWKRTEARAK